MDQEAKKRSAIDVIRHYAASEKTNLPVFPGVAFELQQLMADDNTSVDQVSRVIGKDQALTLGVLKMANSALFLGAQRVSTVMDAIMRLGFNHVLNLVICISQEGLYKSLNPTLDKFMQVAWKHALLTATGSKWLAKELGYVKLRDEAFLAGLLHDIGKLALIRALEALASKNSKMVLSDAFVGKVLSILHAEQGYKLMDEWGIPSVYCNVALNHHKEDFDEDDDLLMIVRVVNHASKTEGISTSNEARADLLNLPEVQALDISADVLVELDDFICEGMAAEFKI